MDKLEELVVDILVWSRERTPTVWEEFVDELRRNAEMRGCREEAEELIRKAEEFGRL